MWRVFWALLTHPDTEWSLHVVIKKGNDTLEVRPNHQVTEDNKRTEGLFWQPYQATGDPFFIIIHGFLRSILGELQGQDRVFS